MISIIIPTLNEELYLPKLLDSLARQNDQEFEVIVADGVSKDKTVAIARSYAKSIPRLKIINCKRASLPMQRNKGASCATGEWLVFVDADSILMPYFIERMKTFIQTSSPQWFTTWCLPDSDSTNDAIITLFANIYWESTILIKRPVAPGPLNCIRKDIFNTIGGYNEEQQYNEDVELGLNLDKHGVKLMFLREGLYVWSMRRLRKENKLKVMNQYIVSMIPIILFRRPFKTMPGYTMGGHMYAEKKPSIMTVKRFEQSLKKLLRVLFE